MDELTKPYPAVERLLALFPSRRREDYRKAVEAAVESAVSWWDEEVTSAIQYLDGNEESTSNSELHRKLREAFSATQQTRLQLEDLLELIPERTNFGGAGPAYGILTKIVSEARKIRKER